MDGGGVERGKGLWRNLKQRLRLKGIGLCGSSWSLEASNINPLEEEPIRGSVGQIPAEIGSAPPCVGRIPVTRASSGMNLATALAAERNPRPAGIGAPNITPLRSLFEETDCEDRKMGKTEGLDEACCVCMERLKDAAFIPCGHTYCRVCSRKLWSSCGSCPICSRTITEVLDIF
ncbi:E3 ubiquitin-protein ligase LUL4 [Actinidia chinensis var. chinensis]|uniref:E3 ubiquitin-protein ligase LUL4 n=1 Tax=Actinidia chinensis var. chinensis TaxID=1590841 RepID=A0A2R6QT97_ACTCC|nr:E3 ubiquitin-protein ligase LUL4 [Actinidia chinensis var. chinensis]